MEGLGVTPPDRTSLLMVVTPPARTSLTVVTGVSADIADGIMGVTPPDRTSLTLVTEVKTGTPVWIDLMCVTPPDRRLSSSERNTGTPREISPPDRMGGVVAPPARLVVPVPFPRETLVGVGFTGCRGQ